MPVSQDIANPNDFTPNAQSAMDATLMVKFSPDITLGWPA